MEVGSASFAKASTFAEAPADKSEVRATPPDKNRLGSFALSFWALAENGRTRSVRPSGNLTVGAGGPACAHDRDLFP